MCIRDRLAPLTFLTCNCESSVSVKSKTFISDAKEKLIARIEMTKVCVKNFIKKLLIHYFDKI